MKPILIAKQAKTIGSYHIITKGNILTHCVLVDPLRGKYFKSKRKWEMGYQDVEFYGLSSMAFYLKTLTEESGLWGSEVPSLAQHIINHLRRST